MTVQSKVQTEVRPSKFLQALCCPLCGGGLAQEEEPALTCKDCEWQSQTLAGDTPSFMPQAYDGPRTQTQRVAKAKPQWWLRLQTFYRRLVFWRRWVLRAQDIEPLRQQELQAVAQQLRRFVPTPRPLLLELGVGFQDHRQLYREFVQQAICSDIYRDAKAAALYGSEEDCFYGVMDVRCLPLAPQSVDVVLTSHVVEHFPDQAANLQALYDAMQPGAVACHVVPIASGLWWGHVLATFTSLLTLTPALGRGVHGEFDSMWHELRETRVQAWRRRFLASGLHLLAESPGSLALAPLPVGLTSWLSRHLGIYGSRVFVLRKPG